MKSKLLTSLLLIACVNNVHAADAASSAESANTSDVEVNLDGDSNQESNMAGTRDFCFFAGTPPSDVKYTVIKKLKVGKGTYGSVTDILPKFAGYAQKVGADAVIDYTGSQRFGFWPWRLVRPVVRGTAVKWTSPPKSDCTAMGGSTLTAILATNKPPSN